MTLDLSSLYGSDTSGVAKFIRASLFTFTGFTYAFNPLASELVSVVNAVDAANGVQVIAAQPAVACKLNIRIVDGDSSISAGTCAVVGVDQNGVTRTYVAAMAGGTRTLVTTYAYISVTSVTIAGLVGAVGGDTIGVGQSEALGLFGCPSGANYTVFQARVGNDINSTAIEAIGTVDATAGTITPTTHPNGAKEFAFYYTYSLAA